MLIKSKVRFHVPLSFLTPRPTGDYQPVPLVIVFTQYDRLLRTKIAELAEDEGITDHARSEEDARKAFDKCVGLVEKTITRYLKVPMPRFAKVSGMYVRFIDTIRC